MVARVGPAFEYNPIPSRSQRAWRPGQGHCPGFLSATRQCAAGRVVRFAV